MTLPNSRFLLKMLYVQRVSSFNTPLQQMTIVDLFYLIRTCEINDPHPEHKASQTLARKTM